MDIDLTIAAWMRASGILLPDPAYASLKRQMQLHLTAAADRASAVVCPECRDGQPIVAVIGGVYWHREAWMCLGGSIRRAILDS